MFKTGLSCSLAEFGFIYIQLTWCLMSVKLIPLLRLNFLKKLRTSTGRKQNGCVWLSLWPILCNWLFMVFRGNAKSLSQLIERPEVFQNVISILLLALLPLSQIPQKSSILSSEIPQQAMLRCHTTGKGGANAKERCDKKNMVLKNGGQTCWVGKILNL